MNKFLPFFLLMIVSGCACPHPPCNASLPAGEPHSCPDPSRAAGSYGGRCADWPSPSCGTNLNCDNGTCVSCGGPGQACCGPAHICQGGAICDSTPTVDWHCASTCGGAGQACCYNNVCQGGLACNLGSRRCETASADPCTGGGSTYLVGVVDSNSRCAITAVSQTGSSPDQAQMCVASRLPAGRAATDPTLHAQDYDFCQENEMHQRTTIHVTAYSDDDARTCAHFQCVNCTETAGSCS